MIDTQYLGIHFFPYQIQYPRTSGTNKLARKLVWEEPGYLGTGFTYIPHL